MKWQMQEETWLHATISALFLAAYADDMVLLATSRAQMSVMIAEVATVLSNIGLKLSVTKCKYMRGPFVEDRAVAVGGQHLQQTQTLIFLGILMGFSTTCVDVMTHRPGAAARTFHGFYRILCRGTAPVPKRLQLLDSFITSKWRWMAPAV